MAESKTASDIREDVLKDLYSWVDQVPLSRPKKDIKRDFSDGVLVSEVVKFFIPHMVELHNYSTANALAAKITNWNLLNRKVFHRLGFDLGKDIIKNVVTCKPWAVDKVLLLLRRKIDLYLCAKQQRSGKQSNFRHLEFYYTKSGNPPEASGDSTTSLGKAQSLHNIHDFPTTQQNRNKMFPRLKVEEKDQESLTKDGIIQILQAKVKRLKSLLHVKDMRIEDLQERLKHNRGGDTDNDFMNL